ncbi:MAG: DUF2914 domain-containing protein [Candidatus Thiodiazotropha sp.]
MMYIHLKRSLNTLIANTLLILVLQLGVPNLSAEELQESPVPDAYVARAQFTTAVVDREPVDQVIKLDTRTNRVFFFTDLRHLQGRTVTHRWELDGRIESVVDFKVGGPRWRVYSAKSLKPDETGKWTVFVIDESGWPLHATIFEYGDRME